MSYRDCYVWLIINEGDYIYKERWYVHDNLMYLSKMYPTATTIQLAKTEKESDALVAYWNNKNKHDAIDVIRNCIK